MHVFYHNLVEFFRYFNFYLSGDYFVSDISFETGKTSGSNQARSAIHTTQA